MSSTNSTLGVKAEGNGQEEGLHLLQDAEKWDKFIKFQRMKLSCVYVCIYLYVIAIDVFKDLCVWGNDIRHKEKSLLFVLGDEINSRESQGEMMLNASAIRLQGLEQ